jgi:hypothetical protein
LKRGLIAWDKQEIPQAVFEERLGRVRQVLAEHQLPALVVYSELWRSNSARFLSNFMPYFNRALLILPLEGSPTLFCGLSPRVYGWIRSVTTIEDVKPAGNFARPLAQLAAERDWHRLGCLEFDQFPNDLNKALMAESIEMVPIDLARVYPAGSDNAELAMRRKVVALARHALAEEMPAGVGKPDHRFVGRLERRLRRQGVEDLITLVTNGDAPPAPPLGAILKKHYSVSLAVEYRGHWVRVSRPCGSEEALLQCSNLFDAVLASPQGASALFENLSGSYPYERMDATDLRPGSLVAIHVEFEHEGRRLFYGDSCTCDHSGLHTL